MNYHGSSWGSPIGQSEPLPEWPPPSPRIVQQGYRAMALPSPEQILYQDDEPSCLELTPWFGAETDPACSIGQSTLSARNQEVNDQSEDLSYERISSFEDWANLSDLPWSPVDKYYNSSGRTYSITCPTKYGKEEGTFSGKQIENLEIKTKAVHQNLRVARKPIGSRGGHRTPSTRYEVERKRRNRISEKIAALHNLIPNARKRDMASMLDDIIKYVKSLQMQLQAMQVQRSAECNALISAGFTGHGYLRPCLQFPPSPFGQLGAFQAMNFGGASVQSITTPNPSRPFLQRSDPTASTPYTHGQSSSSSPFLMLMPNPSHPCHVSITPDSVPPSHHNQTTKAQTPPATLI